MDTIILRMNHQIIEKLKLNPNNSHPAPQPEDQVQGALLLDVVIGESATILQLLAGKDEPLLIWGNSLLVLNLSFDILNGIRRLHLQSDRLAGQSLHEDLHTTSQPEDQVEGTLLLNVVVGERSAVFQLLASENQPLLVRWDSLLVLDLGLNVLYRVGWLHLEGDGLASQGLHEDLHASPQPKD